MKRISGFTLIELMITVAIATVLLGIGIPALSDFVTINRRAAAVNTLVTDIQRARSMAITRRSQMVVCRSIDGANCMTGGPKDWSNGWILFLDANRDNTVDAGEEILNSQAALANISMPANIDRLVYRAGGGASSSITFGTIAVCVDNNNANGRMVVVNMTGRPRLADTVSDGLSCS